MSSRSEYAFYKSLGICPTCRHEKAAPGRVNCLNCLTNRRVYNEKYKRTCPPQVMKKNRENSVKKMKELREYRKQNGLCVACGKKPARKERTSCYECALKDKNRHKRERERLETNKHEKPSNICYMCDKAVYKNFKVCKQHYDHLISIGKLSNSRKSIKKNISEMYKKNHCAKKENEPKIVNSYKQIGV